MPWCEASAHYNTSNAVKVVSRLAGNTISADEAELVVNYILDQMAAGQTFDAMVEWAMNALDNIDHSDPSWGNAAALFDSSIEVSRYYSIDKVGAATSPLSLQHLFTQMPSGRTFSGLIGSTSLC